MTPRHGVELQDARGSAFPLDLLFGAFLGRVLAARIHDALQAAVLAAKTNMKFQVHLQRAEASKYRSDVWGGACPCATWAVACSGYANPCLKDSETGLLGGKLTETKAQEIDDRT